MFEYRSDIAVIHGAFLYIEKHMLDNSDAVNCLMNVLTNSSSIDNELQIKRIHAALFVSLIRPENLKDDDFGAVDGLFLKCNWNLYFQLVKKALWRNHFIECCLQVDDEILRTVIVKTLDHIRETYNENNAYLISCTIQALLKCNKFEDLFKECFVLFEKSCNDIESIIETLSALCKHLLNNMLSEKSQQILLLLNKWSHLLTKIYTKLNEAPSINFERNQCYPLFSLLRYISVTVDWNSLQSDEVTILFNLRTTLLKNERFGQEEVIFLQDYNEVSQLLKEQINSDTIEQTVQIEFGAKNAFQLMKRLLKICLESKDELLVKNLSKEFLQIALLPLNGISDQEKLLLVLDVVGAKTGPLKELDYSEKLVLFLNQSIETDYEESLLQLGLQSPAETVSYIFQQAIENGGQTSLMVKMLTFLSPVCQFKNDNEEGSILIELIHSTAQNANSLTLKEKQNFVKCIQLLSVDHPNGIINLHDLCKCLFEMLHFNTSHNIIDLLLDIIIQILQAERDVKLDIRDISSQPLEIIVCLFLKLADYFTKSGYITMRDKITKIMRLFKTMNSNEEIYLNKKKQNWLLSQLKDTHELLQLEAGMFFNYEVFSNSGTIYELLLRVCIYGSNIEINSHKFDRISTVIALGKILPFATEEESIRMADFLKRITEDNEIKNLMEDTIKLYIDAVILIAISEQDPINWAYILTSLGYVVKNCGMETTEQLATLFREICHLTNYLPDTKKVCDAILNILLQIDGVCQEGTDKTFKNHCIQSISNDNFKVVLIEMLC